MQRRQKLPPHHFLLRLLSCIILLSVSTTVVAQTKKDSVIYSETDLPTLLFKKTPVDSFVTGKIKKYNFAVLPVVGYAPANGFVIGAALSAATNFGDPKNTRQSSGLLNITTTTKDQVIFIARAGIALPKNDMLFDVDTRFLVFTQDTYGLGIHTGKEGEPDYAQPQPMEFN